MAYEDLTTFTEVDPDGYFTVITLKCTWLNAPADNDDYVYKDYGVDHFGDMEHLVDTNETDSTGFGAYIGIWAISNEIGQIRGHNNNVMVIFMGRGGGNCNIIIRTKIGGVITSDWSIVLAEGSYYVTIERAGNLGTVKIYSDSARTNLLDTLILTINNNAFRYLYCGSTYDNNSAINSDGYNENFDLQEAPPPSGGSMQPMKHWGAI